MHYFFDHDLIGKRKPTAVVGCKEAIEMIESVLINPPKKGVYVDIKTAHDTIWLDVGNLYLEFSRITQDTFQLVQSHSVDYPVQHPVVSWSGVLWTRQAALEAHQSLIAYHQGINQIG